MMFKSRHGNMSAFLWTVLMLFANHFEQKALIFYFEIQFRDILLYIQI